MTFRNFRKFKSSNIPTSKGNRQDPDHWVGSRLTVPNCRFRIHKFASSGTCKFLDPPLGSSALRSDGVAVVRTVRRVVVIVSDPLTPSTPACLRHKFTHDCSKLYDFGGKRENHKTQDLQLTVPGIVSNIPCCKVVAGRISQVAGGSLSSGRL